MGCGILPEGDDTEELSMKAPMSLSKPADLGYWVPIYASKLMVTGSKGHNVYPGSGPLDGGKPYSCLIDIDDMGSTRVDLPRDQGG